jgi:hypothetical protein
MKRKSKQEVKNVEQQIKNVEQQIKNVVSKYIMQDNNIENRSKLLCELSKKLNEIFTNYEWKDTTTSKKIFKNTCIFKGVDPVTKKNIQITILPNSKFKINYKNGR